MLEWYGELDERNYFVDFQKISNALNFKVGYYPEDVVEEIMKVLDHGIIEDILYTKVIVRWEHLQPSGEV
ncbi:MAG: hypothetical protein QW806_07065 [Nitrososphaerota archaeon]